MGLYETENKGELTWKNTKLVRKKTAFNLNFKQYCPVSTLSGTTWNILCVEFEFW